MAKEYTQAELADLGRKVLEMRKKSQEKSKERNHIKTRLYQMFKNGELGNVKL